MASPRAERLALALGRQIDSLVSPGLRQLRVNLFDGRVSILRAVVDGKPTEYIEGVLDEMQRRVAPLLSSSMLLADLSARVFFERRGILQLARPPLEDPVHQNAIDALKSRLKLTDREFLDIARKHSADAAKQTRVAGGVLRKNVLKAVQESVRKGLHVADGIRSVRRALGSGQAPGVYENIYRTGTKLAYSAGRWQANQEPEADEFLWGYEYVTAGDDRVRENHEALDGTRLPKNHPLWKKIWPPNGWGCRCDVIEIYRGDPLAKIKQPRKGAAPDKGWSFNPGIVLRKAA